jgi:hypothetical protein
MLRPGMERAAMLMIMAALLASAGAADPALVARGDELNQLYVECMFALSREARQKGLEEDAFASLLARSCSQERKELRQVMVTLQMQRGVPSAQAEAEWARLEAQGRASVERAYGIGRGGF